MILYFIRDLGKSKITISIMLLMLTIVISISNLILLYFYGQVNLDRSKNQYYNIYLLKLEGIDIEEVKKIQEEIESTIPVLQEGYSLTGILSMGSKKVRGISFTEEDTSKFYTTGNTDAINEGSIILRRGFQLNETDWTEMGISDFITNGDGSILIDCVVSQRDFLSKAEKIECLGIEFSKHLSFTQLSQLKKLTKKYSSVKMLAYQKGISLSALKGLKNLLLLSLFMIVYMVSATLGLLRHFFSKKAKAIKAYYICGATKKQLYIGYGVQTVILYLLVQIFSIPISILLYRQSDYPMEGGLLWLPFLISAVILLVGIGAVLQYEVGRLWKEVMN